MRSGWDLAPPPTPDPPRARPTRPVGCTTLSLSLEPFSGQGWPAGGRGAHRLGLGVKAAAPSAVPPRGHAPSPRVRAFGAAADVFLLAVSSWNWAVGEDGGRRHELVNSGIDFLEWVTLDDAWLAFMVSNHQTHLKPHRLPGVQQLATCDTT